MTPAGPSALAKPTVAFLGPLATYSHQATLELFGDDGSVDLRPCETIKDAFDAIKPREGSAQAQYAVVPLENSTHGPVLETTTLLFAYGDSIARYGRHTLDIRHSLMRKPGVAASAPVASICSHTQALGQCARYLRSRYPDVRRVEVASTAAAAQMALEHEGVLAVCSDLCASVYGLDVVDADIQDGGTSALARLDAADRLGNRTAFLLIALAGTPRPKTRSGSSM